MADVEPGPSRRFVLGAGVHATWAVPVVVLAAAAPAYASSGNLSMVTLLPLARTPSPTNVGNVNTLRPVITVTNSDTTTAALRIVVTVTPADAGDNFSGSVTTVPAGYTLDQSAQGPAAVVFTYTATTQLQPGSPLTFQPVISLSLAVAGTLRVDALPGGNGTAGTASATFT